MSIIINIFGKIMLLVDIEKKEVISLINIDCGLVRYITKILKEFVASNTNNGYIQFLNKTGETYLHRIILEYYSQFDTKLFTILKNSDYEVNHKNKMVWDNRLENLELVTRIGQERHKRGKKYEDEIVMSTEELIAIRQKLKEDKRYKTDKKYLEKVSHNNMECLKEKKLNNKFFENLYIRFNNIKINNIKITSNDVDTNTLGYINKIIFYVLKNTFFTYRDIENTIIGYNIYRCKSLFKNNIKLIIKYYKSNTVFREICHKYNLLNFNYLDLNNFIEHANHNILIDLFVYIFPNKFYFTFYKNQIQISVSVKDLVLTRGKYNSFRVLYLLHLLERKRNTKSDYRYRSKARIETEASYFIVNKYTDDLFKHTVLPIAKKLRKQNLSTITHTIITKNYSVETADRVYQNSTRKKATKKSLGTISDIEYLLSTSLLEKINLYGYITISDIRVELEKINEKRKEELQPFVEIREKDNVFISKMVRNLIEIKELMKKLKIGYRTLNKKTKDKITKYQEKNKIADVTTTTLTYRQKIIVLNKLYVSSKKK